MSKYLFIISDTYMKAGLALRMPSHYQKQSFMSLNPFFYDLNVLKKSNQKKISRFKFFEYAIKVLQKFSPVNVLIESRILDVMYFKSIVNGYFKRHYLAPESAKGSLIHRKMNLSCIVFGQNRSEPLAHPKLH